ncbi:MAG: hypothetical protein IJG38_06760 [Thermoguttaceae bacterium]|nr:hypothetical protein [Thermoguttaceae bacterium]MBQ6615733.1 hypothetical protein [Thermoguttaceae bacterium]
MKPISEIKQREILALLSVGCSRRTAARYVNCTQKAIDELARTNPDFAEKLRRAEANLEIESIKNMFNAAKQEKNWRASAWLLERKSPQEFLKKKPDVIPAGLLDTLLNRIVTLLIEECPAAVQRKGLLKKLDVIRMETIAALGEDDKK